MSGAYRVLANTIPVSVPSIAGDLYTGNSNTALFSINQGQSFIIDVVLTFQEETTTTPEGGGEPTTAFTNIDITEVISTLEGGYGSPTFTVLDTDPIAYKIRITGPVTQVIAGGTYNVVLPAQPGSNNFPTAIVPDNAKPDSFLAIYGWSPTQVYWQLLPNNYKFIVNPEVENEIKTMSQYVYWSWNIALQQFKDIVSEGDI